MASFNQCFFRQQAHAVPFVLDQVFVAVLRPRAHAAGSPVSVRRVYIDDIFLLPMLFSFRPFIAFVNFTARAVTEAMSVPNNESVVVGPEPANSLQQRLFKPDVASFSESTASNPLQPVPSTFNYRPLIIESEATISGTDHAPVNPPKVKKTLDQLTGQQVLEQLKEAVKGYQSAASYCCGGSIPISGSVGGPSLANSTSRERPLTAPPIGFRWDVSPHDTARTVHFPLEEAQNSSSRDALLLNELLQSCAPATFGRKDKDILDEGYRKAGKLDRSQFSVDFHPHDYGIIDAISQILLPEISADFLKDREEHRGVVAELYKLNVSRP